MTHPNAVKPVLVIHGPNLNMLGAREPEIYGTTRLTDIDRQLQEQGSRMGFEVECFQSNHEGAIVDKIQDAVGMFAGLVINPGAYTHTSVAIRDALLLWTVPIIEVHLSNIHQREPFRHHSFISDVATGQIVGLGVQGYFLALKALVELTDSQRFPQL